jgi:hypothetical protein
MEVTRFVASVFFQRAFALDLVPSTELEFDVLPK